MMVENYECFFEARVYVFICLKLGMVILNVWRNEGGNYECFFQARVYVFKIKHGALDSLNLE